MIAAAALLYAALFLLAAAMPRHAPALLGRAARTPARLLPAGGWSLLALSLVPVALAPRWDYALIEWLGLAAVMAGIILLGLTYGATAIRAGLLVAIAALCWAAIA